MHADSICRILWINKLARNVNVTHAGETRAHASWFIDGDGAHQHEIKLHSMIVAKILVFWQKATWKIRVFILLMFCGYLYIALFSAHAGEQQATATTTKSRNYYRQRQALLDQVLFLFGGVLFLASGSKKCDKSALDVRRRLVVRRCDVLAGVVVIGEAFARFERIRWL